MQSAKQSADESLRPVNDVISDVIPGNRNPSTSWRWINRGIAGRDGERIRLQVWYVGRQPHTTEAAVREFIEAVTAARLARMQQSQQQAADVTDAELAAVGLRPPDRTTGVGRIARRGPALRMTESQGGTPMTPPDLQIIGLRVLLVHFLLHSIARSSRAQK